MFRIFAVHLAVEAASCVSSYHQTSVLVDLIGRRGVSDSLAMIPCYSEKLDLFVYGFQTIEVTGPLCLWLTNY